MYLKTLLNNAIVPPVVAMCVPSTCKHLIKSFEQILKLNGSLQMDFSGI